MTQKLREIPVSDRTEGMVDASASYYQESDLFIAIQNAQALEYDRVYEANLDLALQLSPYTATWGLIHWEQANGLTPNPLGDYEKRRPLVLARMASDRNFGADMVHKLAKNYGEDIRVSINTADCLVTVVFQRGVPSFLEEFKAAIENIIHAHLEAEYKFEYHINGALQIETSYSRYVYGLPKAGVSTICGTLPSTSVQGRFYVVDISAYASGYEKSQDYKTAGTYASGPFPFVAIDGVVYNTDIATGATEHNTTEHYTRCNEIYSGGEPIK